MKRTTVVLLLFYALLLARAQHEKVPNGAWLQDGVKWLKAPADVNPKLQYGQAAILYFGADQTFALIYAVVNRVPNEYEVISNGDGQVLYLGTWEVDDGKIRAKYRLVSRTVPRKGEVLPGPVIEGVIHIDAEALTLDRREFHRAQALDKSVAAVVASTNTSGPGAAEVVRPTTTD